MAVGDFANANPAPLQNADACHHQDHLRPHPPADGVRSFYGRMKADRGTIRELILDHDTPLDGFF